MQRAYRLTHSTPLRITSSINPGLCSNFKNHRFEIAKSRTLFNSFAKSRTLFNTTKPLNIFSRAKPRTIFDFKNHTFEIAMPRNLTTNSVRQVSTKEIIAQEKSKEVETREVIRYREGMHLSLTRGDLKFLEDLTIKGVRSLHLKQVYSATPTSNVPIFPDVTDLFIEDASEEFIDWYVKLYYFPSVTTIWLDAKPSGNLRFGELQKKAQFFITSGYYNTYCLEHINTDFIKIDIETFKRRLDWFASQ